MLSATKNEEPFAPRLDESIGFTYPSLAPGRAWEFVGSPIGEKRGDLYGPLDIQQKL
jgi:hypothetical protein